VICLALGIGLFRELRLSNASAPAPSCQLYFREKQLCATLEWTKRPLPSNPAEFQLRFWDARNGSSQGPFVAPPGELKVSLWMPAMGHGAEPVRLERESEAKGVYKVSHVSLSMAGDWEIWVSLLDGDRFIEKAKTLYRL
jgi:hypothetical protein